MSLSWSQKLFLKINKNVGNHPILDKFMFFCSKWLINFLATFAFFWIMFNFYGDDFLIRIGTLAFAIVVLYSISLTIGFIVKKPRPEVEFPQTKQLVHTIYSWKSFPSDHTNTAFLITYLLIFFGLEIYFWPFLFLSAILIGVGRVFSGVHYPRDILGGFIISTIFSFIFYGFVFI
jgi:undecaprenyl-diphosphatase